METEALSNAEIADQLLSLAQLLSMEKANPYKVRAYRRGAAVVRTLGESLDSLVRLGGDLTVLPGIGTGIDAAIREIVLSGKLGKLDKLKQAANPELLELSLHPRLDPQRVLRIYKKLGIHSVGELKKAWESGAVQAKFGARMAQHVEQGLVENHTILLYHAHPLVERLREFLLKRCKAGRADAVGEYRRSVEVVSELEFLVPAEKLDAVSSCMEQYGGRTPLLSRNKSSARFSLPSGPALQLHAAEAKNWGTALIRHTGSKEHLRKLQAATGSLQKLEETAAYRTEEAFYRDFGMQTIPPELREGLDEVRLARRGALPDLIRRGDVRGDLHTHTTASDGSDSLDDMASAARELGYEYVGISDHSQSLKIARGLSVEEMWEQIRSIDELNGRLNGIRVLKSAEVDILADGSLDYPDDLLRELDYTVCSIHSRFGMNKEQQTERILRAMDNRYFTILGHATGRLLLKRPGYEVDFERVAEHAKQSRKYFEINSSPDRLDLSAEHARMAKAAGILIAISTDSHSTGEYGTIRYGIEQARRAGLTPADVLNSRGLNDFLTLVAHD